MRIRLLFALVALVAFPAAGHAQRRSHDDLSTLGLGASVSTLGIAPEVSIHLSPYFGLRGGFHYLKASLEDEVEDVSYDLHPRLRNITALADLHPFGNAFRLTGGLVFWDSRVDAEGTLKTAVDLGNNTYQPAEVGALIGRADYANSVVPMFGLGFAGRGRFAITFDLGVVVTGRPTVDLSVDSPLSGAALAQLESDVAAEELEIRNSIEDEPLAKFYPLISLGFRLRF